MDSLLFSAPFKAVFTNLGTSGRLLHSKTHGELGPMRQRLLCYRVAPFLPGGNLDRPAHPKI